MPSLSARQSSKLSYRAIYLFFFFFFFFCGGGGGGGGVGRSTFLLETSKYCKKCLAKNGNFDFFVMTLQTSCGAFRQRERERVTLQMSYSAERVDRNSTYRLHEIPQLSHFGTNFHFPSSLAEAQVCNPACFMMKISPWKRWREPLHT